jgi:6-phosphogluconolactonase
MMAAAMPLLAFESREDLALAVADALEAVIRDALANRPRARIALSGGGTPGPAYRLLADRALDWSRVDLALVDDRWVAPGEPGSNETLLREAFAQADGAAVHGMWAGGHDAAVDAAAREAVYAALLPFDGMLLGMGSDAHTASWFPGSKGLEDAMSPQASSVLAAIDASGCPGSQVWPHRITLTLPPVASAGWIGLMLTGADKRSVLEAALGSPVLDAPICGALEAAAGRAVVLYAD